MHMGLRYRKTIKLFDGLNLNISTSGVSLSVGKKGARINLGPKGTYLNLGLKGTGLSYRTKIGKGYKEIIEDLKKDDDDAATDAIISKKTNNKKTEKYQKVIDEYNEELDRTLNMHKQIEKVATKKQFEDAIKEASLKDRAVLNKRYQGDEDTIESTIGDYLKSISSDLEIRVNYELEDNILYVDLDLPKIEHMNAEYPALDEDNTLQLLRKTQLAINEEYVQIVCSLAIYLAGNFFNVSPCIDTIVMSGYTQREVEETIKDVYLFSVNFIRDVFEKTSFKKLKIATNFIKKFENRMDIDKNYVFHEILPYPMVLEDR